ncbi:MAG: aldehyde ferredoxin oxidoreductase, partial [Gammaproteobacteria bacterium]|nr:aldehyde ferredoxin oxidoreductase [Gammaproteobacteria bacterium]
FNMRAGMTADQDTLPKRLLKDAANVGPAQGRVNDLDKMLPEYYQLRGWTEDGQITPETRARVGI